MDLRINDYYNAGSIYSTGRLYMMTHTAPSDSVSAVTPVKKVAPVVSGTPAAIYEVSEKEDLKPTYSINKMSKEQRADLVAQLKADQERRAGQLTDLVSNMMIGQSDSLAKSDDIWKFLARGNFTVTPEVKAQAQKDIAEDGYWGVAQTSQRLFDFASALAGNDAKKMHQMEAAMEKGFKQAMGAWGRELPDISRDTMEASRKLFADYYEANKKEEAAVAV